MSENVVDQAEVDRMGRVVMAQEAVLESLAQSKDPKILKRLPTLRRYVSLSRNRYERAGGRLVV